MRTDRDLGPLSFWYGLLERLDTFRLNTAEEREEALALIADPHARFVRYLAPRRDAHDSTLPMHTMVSDLSCLAEHPTLSNIKLDETEVRDISPLQTIPHLCRIGHWDTHLTEEEVAPLKAHIADAERVEDYWECRQEP